MDTIDALRGEPSMSIKIQFRARTLLLGAVAFLAVVYGLIFVLELPRKLVAQLLLASTILVGALALGGLIAAAIWSLLRRWLGTDATVDRKK